MTNTATHDTATHDTATQFYIDLVRASTPETLIRMFDSLGQDDSIAAAGHTVMSLLTLALNEHAANAIRAASEANAIAKAANREVERLFEQAKRIRETEELTAKLAARGLKPCPRCGGAGGSKRWADFTCYTCNGSGTRPLKSGSRA